MQCGHESLSRYCLGLLLVLGTEPEQHGCCVLSTDHTAFRRGRLRISQQQLPLQCYDSRQLPESKQRLWSPPEQSSVQRVRFLICTFLLAGCLIIMVSVDLSLTLPPTSMCSRARILSDLASPMLSSGRHSRHPVACHPFSRTRPAFWGTRKRSMCVIRWPLLPR